MRGSFVTSGGGLGLAARAEVGGAAGEDDALDGGAAFAAGLIFAGVDAVEVLEAAGLAVDINVIAQGAAAVTDGAAEDGLDGAGEAADLLGGEVMGWSEGMDAGGEEGFVHVDVAQAGDEGLVEKSGLDGAAGAMKAIEEFGGSDGEGFGAEIGVGGLAASEPPDAAEAAGVAEAELLMRFVFEGDQQVGMGAEGSGGGFDRQLAGHAKVDAEGTGVVESDQDLLAASVDSLDLNAGEFRR